MDFLALLNFNDVSLGISQLSMYPLFDSAHYIVSVMSLKEQPGAVDVARRSPVACWFSSMLYCFGGAILSGVMLAEPPVAPFSNNSNVLLASLAWYLVFYCPLDLVYTCAAYLPVRVVLSAMKEVTRTWKVMGGVAQAQEQYKNAVLVMVAVGWARGAGGGLISNFEQLVRGVWRPETNELLRMSYATKITLIGAVLFTLQRNHYLPVQEHQLMSLYTTFLIVTKVRMMLTGCPSPFAAVETALHRLLFGLPVMLPPETCAAGSSKVAGAASQNHSGSSDGDAVHPTETRAVPSPSTTSRTEHCEQTGGGNKKTD